MNKKAANNLIRDCENHKVAVRAAKEGGLKPKGLTIINGLKMHHL